MVLKPVVAAGAPYNVLNLDQMCTCQAVCVCELANYFPHTQIKLGIPIPELCNLISELCTLMSELYSDLYSDKISWMFGPDCMNCHAADCSQG